MKIIELKQTDFVGYYNAIVEMPGEDLLYRGQRLMIDGKRYFVNEFKETKHKTFDIMLYRPEYGTIYSYEKYDFFDIQNIERTKKNEITISLGDGAISTYTFETPEDCLKELLTLNKIYNIERSSNCAG